MTTVTLEKALETLKDAGFKASLWQGKRVYINGLGKDVNAWFEATEEGGHAPFGPFEGLRFVIFINCFQTENWKKNRRLQVLAKIEEKLKEIQG